MRKDKLKPGELRDGLVPVRDRNGNMRGFLHRGSHQAAAIRMLGGRGSPQLTTKAGRLEWRDGEDCDGTE